MQDMQSDVFSSLAAAIPVLLVLIGALIVYLVLLVRAVIEILRYDEHGGVLPTFVFLALVPFPLILVMGIMVLIIWLYHKRDILAGERQTR